MSEELKCPNCQQKDKEIASLIEELNNLSHIFDCIFKYGKTKQWSAVFQAEWRHMGN